MRYNGLTMESLSAFNGWSGELVLPALSLERWCFQNTLTSSPRHSLSKLNSALGFISVAVPGFEPRLREPESRVLPLHHTAV